MKVVINTSAIERNIAKAQSLVNVPISLMFKDFYEHVYSHITNKDTNIFGLHLYNSICYSINKADNNNSGALIVNEDDYRRCFQLGIKNFCIPINAKDDREGLCINEAVCLARHIDKSCSVFGLITSGCINDKSPTIYELGEIYDKIRDYIPRISLGGSYYLSKGHLPYFISDVRIGEYMLFGTIPYDNCKSRLGKNGITLETKVIETFTDRKQILIDCGYSSANIDKCKFLHDYDLSYVNSSSEYSIFQIGDNDDIFVGDTISFIPDYKSLVKLRYAETEYIR